MAALDSRLQNYESKFFRYLEAQVEGLSQSARHDRSGFMLECVDERDPLVRKRIEAEFFGAGPLHDLLSREDLTEIMITAWDSIYFEKGGRIEAHHDRFVSERSYQNFIQRFALENNLNLTLERPMADGRWGDWRFHLILPPLTVSPSLTLRRHYKNTWNLHKLNHLQWSTPKSIEIIRSWVREKRNVLIVGPTNTGKTSLLNALLQECSPHERVVSIEDTDEIQIPNFCSVKLFTRKENSSTLPAVDQQDLVVESLRMRPDRIVLGEMRGAEAKDYLLALSTGHSGSLATLHAESASQALLRLEFLVQMAAPQWSSHAIRQLIHLGLKNIIVLENTEGVRRLQGLYEISSLESTGFCLDQVLVD
jgi:pilus assembly protein CpaF